MLENPHQRATTVKNQDVSEISVISFDEKNNNFKSPGTAPEILTLEPITTTATTTTTEPRGGQNLSIHPVKIVERQTNQQRCAIFVQKEHREL